MAGRTKNTLNSLLRRTEPEPNTGCWLWTGGSLSGPFSYGQVMWHGKAVLVHRKVYELLVGEIPTGMIVCHRCDTPKCVNPKHLFVGSYSDNNQDCLKKGRNRSKSCGPLVNDADSIEIRRLVAVGVDRQSVADTFEITRSYVNCIVRGRAHKRTLGNMKALEE